MAGHVQITKQTQHEDPQRMAGGVCEGPWVARAAPGDERSQFPTPDNGSETESGSTLTSQKSQKLRMLMEAWG